LTALTEELGPIIEKPAPFKSPTKFRPLTVTSDVDPMREVEEKGFEEERKGNEPLGNEAFPWKVGRNCYPNLIDQLCEGIKK